MRDYKEREQHRLAEERWSKSTRQPAKEELDPRVYGRYDEKQEDRKALEEKYREKQKELKRSRRRRGDLVELNLFYNCFQSAKNTTIT